MDDVDVLVIEDNSGDVTLIERAFEDQGLPGTLHAVQTGDEALGWLYQRDEFAEAPRPDLVLLDLNLPATSGHTVLEEIKSDPDLMRVPVIVLTGSHSEEHLAEAYERSANACLVKPVDPDRFGEIIRAFADFWVTRATLPPVASSTGDPLR